MEYQKGQEVEVSSTEEGFEDSWFIATIISKSNNKINRYLVQYHTLLHHKQPKPLREHADSSHIRPLQPKGTPRFFKPHDEVDVFHNDGWWKGVVTKVTEGSNYSVYFKRTKEEMEFQNSDLRLHMEWVNGKWTDASPNQETSVVRQNEASLQSPNPTEGCAFRADTATPESPSAVSNIMGEDVLSVSGSISGRMDNESVANGADLHSDPLFSIQMNLNMKQSTPRNREFLTPLKKAVEVETPEASMAIKACNARGTSIGSSMDLEAQLGKSLSTTRGKRSKLQHRRASNPVFSEQMISSSSDRNIKDNFVPLHEGQTKDELNGNMRNLSNETIMHVHKGPLNGTDIKLQENKSINNQREEVVKRKRGRPKKSVKSHCYGNSESRAPDMSVQSNGLANECTSNEVTNVQKECNLLPSYIVEDNQTRPSLLEKIDAPIVEESGGTEDEAFNRDLMTVQVECTQVSIPSIEDRRGTGNLLVIGRNEYHGQCRKEHQTVLALTSQQMNNPSHGTEIKLHERDQVDNPTEKNVKRKKGTLESSARKRHHLGSSNSLASGISIQTSGQEELTRNEMANPHNECTMLLSYTVKEHQTALEKTCTLLKENEGTENEAPNKDLIISDVECTRLSSPALEDHHSNLEEPCIEECAPLLSPDREEQHSFSFFPENSDPPISRGMEKCAPLSSPDREEQQSFSLFSEKSDPPISRRNPEPLCNTIEDHHSNGEAPRIEECAPLFRVNREEQQSFSFCPEKSDPPISRGRAANNDFTIIQIDQSQLCSTVDVQQNSLCLLNSNPHIPEDDEDDLLEAITLRNTSTKSLKNPRASNEVESLFSLEAQEDESGLQFYLNVTTNTCSSPLQQNEGPPESEILPFTKSSSMWDIIESREVFQVMPQCPHFRPLGKHNEELREGKAMGYMMCFALLVERTCKAQLDDPTSEFVNRLNALIELEEHGFTVQPIRSRLEALLDIKNRYCQLNERAKPAESEASDEKRQLDEIDETIAQLNKQLQAYLMEKGTKGSKVVELQQMADEVKEKIQGAKHDFNTLVVAPWK